MANPGQTEGRAVDWSFPMNPSHLPPKSPAFPSYGAGPVDSNTTGRTNFLGRGGSHKRTPSAGYLSQTQPSWMDELVDAPEGALKRGAHRRSASESMAFLESHANFSKMVDENITEEEDYESRSVASMHSRGGSLDFDRLDEDQLMSMFGNDSEPYQQHQASNQNGHSDVLRATSASNVGGSSASDTWTLERGRNTLSKPNAPSTPSDSNSISEVSNEEPMQEGLEKFRSEPEVQSFADLYNEGGSQQFSKGELQQALAGLDSSLDPKRAKRILANRQSAQRSRVRKLQYISELERSVTTLQTEVSTMAPQVAFFEHRRAVLNVDNNTIKQTMAALVQGQRFKDAHNEALKKEVQRLRQVYQQQQIQQQQHLQLPQQQQQNAPSSAYDLQQQQFSKMDLSASRQSDSDLAGPDRFSNGLAGGAEPMSNGSGGLSPTHSRSRSLPHSINMVASNCMLSGPGKGMEGRMMNDYMVHNS